ncbi:glycosyltransferase family 2 protein [Phaeodactylibacter xiamenensis]|uniref:glycosyltransferase family 2 protein n=1 Tax=Phaeodactylibacter xiamenensis TaxID=1524460 RepID=UPI0024A8CE24|nr:glycosyltransferase family 2 protein [Phaeodactylibacter xiamenensis]
MEAPFISIVSPAYRAERILPELVRRIKTSVEPITQNFEIILVEDCGPDDSWSVIQSLSEKEPRVRGFKLSRNYGQHYAITCGLDQAQGDWIVVMDCDLQDQPEEIKKLYDKALEGYDVVLARREERQDNFFKKLFSKLFYRTLGYLTGSKMDESIANFGIYHKSVIKSITQLRESIRYFPTMVKWVGFRQTSIKVEHAPRAEGETSYNFKKLLNLAIDIILAYSDKPIRLTIKAGFLVSFFALLIGLIYLIKYFSGDIIVPGYASLIVSIWFLSGLIITILGVVGLYVGKTFEGVKQRPIYIISDTTND